MLPRTYLYGDLLCKKATFHALSSEQLIHLLGAQPGPLRQGTAPFPAR